MKKSRDKLMAMSALLLLPTAVYASGVLPVIPAPEPSTWSLLGLGAVAAVIASRFKKNK